MSDVSGHTHGHGLEPPPELVRRLNLALVPFALATIVGLVWLWPPADPLPEDVSPVALEEERFEASVVDVSEHPCPQATPGLDTFRCATVTARLDEGSDEGLEVTFEFTGGRGARIFDENDGIILSRPVQQQGAPEYYFVDFQRSRPLLLLAALFAVVVVAFSRWRGIAALAALAVTIFVLSRFVLPAILDGRSPLLVSIVGSAVIMFAALYMSHGFSATTTTAVLGTLASLAITGLLALVFVELANFTGLSSEEATFLQVSAEQINLNGLILGGIIIGALGVLDDVTITQAAAVWEIKAANPAYGRRALYSSALRIGRDHIASTVNTLVLAYAGASLPLLILFMVSERGVGTVLTSEVIAEEIVRTLVGSIGLVASVPITTALAASVAGSTGLPPNQEQKRFSRRSGRGRSAGWRAPRAEREWKQRNSGP